MTEVRPLLSSTPLRTVSRRAAVGTAVWAAPVVVVAGAVPAHASSTSADSVDITVVPVDAANFLMTLRNNTAAPITSAQLRWQFTRTAGTYGGGALNVDGFNFVGVTGNPNAVWTLTWTRSASIPVGTSSYSVYFSSSVADYRADLLFTILPSTGTGGSAATASPGVAPTPGRARPTPASAIVVDADGQVRPASCACRRTASVRARARSARRVRR